MTTKTIPEQVVHFCDVCAAEHTSPYASRPKMWTTLTLSKDALDFQGAAVAETKIRRDLCERCANEIVKAINETCESLRTKEEGVE